MEKPPLESAGGTLQKLSQSKAAKAARGAMVAAAVTGAGCSDQEENTITEADETTEQVKAESAEQMIQTIADRVVVESKGLKASARVGGLGEKAMLEDLLKPYVERVQEQMMAATGEMISTDEATERGYAELREALDRYADKNDLATELTNTPGLHILHRLTGADVEGEAGVDEETKQHAPRGPTLQGDHHDASHL